MSDFISSSDLLKEANLLEGVSTPSVLGSGKMFKYLDGQNQKNQ